MQFSDKTKPGETDLVEYTRKAVEECEKINKEFHYFTTICKGEALDQANQVKEKIKNGTAGKLAGLIITVKDNICVKGVETTATSKILKGYKPLFDATVIRQLKEEDAIVIGKTSCDAFGFGTFNTNVGIGFQIPKHPIEKERVTGGSSGGSAGITAKASFEHVAVAESTGGSIECPAAFCGVIGFVPTYGAISRYGLISYANSLDKIGFMAKKVASIEPVLKIACQKDEKDATSLSQPIDWNEVEGNPRIAVIKEAMQLELQDDVRNAFQKKVEEMKSNGFTIEEISLPTTFKFGIPTYYLIATAEASTNLARYSGLRYGIEGNPAGKTFEEYFSEIRSENFSLEEKRRILLGTFARMAGYRDAFYLRATKVRRKIIEEFENAFKKFDILIQPTMPVTAPKLSEVEKLTPIQSYSLDSATVGPNLAGIPHATIPIETKPLPIGLMAMAGHLKDATLLQFLKKVESIK